MNKKKKKIFFLVFCLCLIVCCSFYIYNSKIKSVNLDLNKKEKNIRIYGTDKYLVEIINVDLPIYKPSGIAVDQSGYVYIADAEKNQIFVLNNEDKLTRIIGKTGNGKGEFLKPQGLFIDNHKLYVADSLNYRVQILNLDGGYQTEIDLLKEAIKPMDVAVIDQEIYFTVNSDYPKKYKIYKINSKNEIFSYGRLLYGYITNVDNEMLAFINFLNIKKGKDGWEARAGEHSMLFLNNDKFKKGFDLPYKYQPLDFVYDSACKEFYIISGAYTSIDRFSKQGKYLETIFNGDQNDFLQYITIDNQGVIYCTSLTNNKIYRIRKK